MRILYQDETVLVTDTTFRIKGRRARSVELARLDRLYVIRAHTSRPGSWLFRCWPAALASTVAIAVAAYGLHAELWEQLLAPTLALLGASVLLAAGPGGKQPTNELWAISSGQHFCLYRTLDVRAFGQISRAVLRAREGAPRG